MLASLWFVSTGPAEWLVAADAESEPPVLRIPIQLYDERGVVAEPHGPLARLRGQLLLLDAESPETGAPVGTLTLEQRPTNAAALFEVSARIPLRSLWPRGADKSADESAHEVRVVVDGLDEPSSDGTTAWRWRSAAQRPLAVMSLMVRTHDPDSPSDRRPGRG